MAYQKVPKVKPVKTPHTAGAPTNNAPAKGGSKTNSSYKPKAMGIKPSYKNPAGKGSELSNLRVAFMAASKKVSGLGKTKGGPSPSGRFMNSPYKPVKNPVKPVTRRSPSSNPQGKGA